MIALLLASLAAAENYALTQELLDLWDILKLEANKVSDRACSGEIATSFVNAEKIYSETGLTQDFVTALNNIQITAGDVPEAAKFRESFGNMTVQSKTLLASIPKYTKKIEEKVKKAGPVAANLNPTNEKKGDYQYGVGTLSSAKVSSFALAVLGAAIVVL
jgi:hypothetical protein